MFAGLKIALCVLVGVHFMTKVSAVTFITLTVETLWNNPVDSGSKEISIYSDQRPADAVADFMLTFNEEIDQSEWKRVEGEYLHLMCSVLSADPLNNNMKLCDGQPASEFVMDLEWPEMTAYLGSAFYPSLFIRKGYSVLYYAGVMCLRIGDLCNDFSRYYISDKLTKTIGNLPKLKSCGFRPANILDIGANIGEWACKTQKLFPDSNIFMIEGNSHCRDKLLATGIPFEISLVGNYEGNSSYFIDSHDLTSTGNSIFKENSGLFTDALEVTVPINTIDNIISARNLAPFQYMKMDIQGAELIALEGASKALETLEVIITEAAVMEYNDFGNSFLEMYVRLDKLGYAMFDVVDVLRDLHNNVAIQFDVLWVRMDSDLWRMECSGYPTPRYFKNLIPTGPDGMPTGLSNRAFYELAQRSRPV